MVAFWSYKHKQVNWWIEEILPRIPNNSSLYIKYYIILAVQLLHYVVTIFGTTEQLWLKLLQLSYRDDGKHM